MKSFLTFTLAAGVAITSTSIAQAQNSSHKANAAASKEGTSKQVGGVVLAPAGLFLDRAALNRELGALTVEFEPFESGDDNLATTAPKKKSQVIWTGG